MLKLWKYIIKSSFHRIFPGRKCYLFCWLILILLYFELDKFREQYLHLNDFKISNVLYYCIYADDSGSNMPAFYMHLFTPVPRIQGLMPFRWHLGTVYLQFLLILLHLLLATYLQERFS